MRLIHSSTKPWVGQFRATTANPKGSDEKMRIWAVLKVKIEDAPVVFKDFVRFCCFLEKMPEYRVSLKAELEDAPVTLTQYYRCVFITCTVKQMFEKK